MPVDSIVLEVVTPERQVVRERVSEIQLPAADGYMGILPGHAPLITALGMGMLSYHKGGEVFYLSVVGGYAEVLADRVIVLAERSETAEEIDVDRAKAARQRAEQRLAKTGDPEMDWNRAMLALQRALLRLQVAAKGGVVAAAEDEHRTA